MELDKFIERRILIGMIVSTDYLQQVIPIYQTRYLESPAARVLAGWCVEYFEKYHKAPSQDIEGIYSDKLRRGLPEDRAEFIEGVLNNLSEEFERGQFNTNYLLDQTEQYFKSRHIQNVVEEAGTLLEEGDVAAAQVVIESAELPQRIASPGIDVFRDREAVERAFNLETHSLIKFPGDLGIFWNDELARDSFVSLLAPEKRGKSFWLMEMAFRAAKSGCNVVFFQAGDMSEEQQLRRMYTYLAGKSYKRKYCGELLVPELDCLLSQMGECDECECSDEPLTGEKNIQELTIDDYVQLMERFPDYSPCRKSRYCRLKNEGFVGAVWYRIRKPVEPLDWREAYRLGRKFLRRFNRVKLSTHPGATLSVPEIRRQLDEWERAEGFVADVVIIDYADLLTHSERDYRHRQNEIWMTLRGLSTDRHCLVITATQSDAAGWEASTLKRSHFSEDKRKFGHVTAMYGLNQTPEEKRKGILRINELVVRDDDFSHVRQVTVLQSLQTGRPFLSSFFSRGTK